MERTWTVGLCWRCEDGGVPVLWLGPVQSAEAGDAPFFCCAPCVRRLEALVIAHNRHSVVVDDNPVTSTLARPNGA
ncbi:hypothetical protein [Streptomyces sp. NPDC006645]|uniref:hypothetical protein n=1 Tax=Streptomyces sp. NPDC006645 TaxID=3157184 RepID=UPI0033B6882E